MKGTALAVALLALSAVPGLDAAPNVWTRVGPEGGSITAFVSVPGRPASGYAGKGSGRQRIAGLAVDAGSPQTLYAASASLGIVKTVDGGISWRAAARGIPLGLPLPVVAVATDATRSGQVYAAARTAAVYQSTDGGASWKALPAAGPRDVIALTSDPRVSNRLYAVTATRQLWVTDDAGRRWRRISSVAGAGESVHGLFVNPLSSDVLYALVYDGDATGLRRSLDRGVTWASFGDASAGEVRAFAIDPSRPKTLYLGADDGIRRSDDGGTTWQPTAGTPPGFQFHLFAFGNALLAQPFAGSLWRSGDRGASWSAVHGVRALSINHVAVAGGRVFVRGGVPSSGAMFRSEDGALSWQPLSPLDDRPYRSFGALFEVDPVHPATIYAGFTEVLARSDDAGDHFSPIESPPCIYPLELAIDPSDSGNLYLSGEPRGAPGCPTSGADRCATYRKLGAAAWECIDANLPLLGLPVAAVDPFDGAILYSFFPWVLLRSDDHGTHWKIVSGIDYLSAIAPDPTRPGVIYEGYLGGTGRSDDFGETWDLSHSGLPGEYVVSLVPDPTRAGRVYATTLDNVWRSDDSGRHWRSVAPGLGETVVVELALDPDDPLRLYVATRGGGLLRLKQRQ